MHIRIEEKENNFTLGMTLHALDIVTIDSEGK